MSLALARRTIPFATLTGSLLLLSGCAPQHIATGAGPRLISTPDVGQVAQLDAGDLATVAVPAPRAAADNPTPRVSFDPVWLATGVDGATPLQLTIETLFTPTVFFPIEQSARAPLAAAPSALDVARLALEGGTIHLDPGTVFLAIADRLTPFEFGVAVRAWDACAWCSSGDSPVESAQIAAAAFTPEPANSGWRKEGDTWTTPRNGGMMPRDGFNGSVTATPEPATLTLTAIGIASLAGLRRRRGRRP